MASFRIEIPPPLGIPLPLESDTDYLLNSPISLSKKFGHVFLFLYSICLNNHTRKMKIETNFMVLAQNTHFSAIPGLRDVRSQF